MNPPGVMIDIDWASFIFRLSDNEAGHLLMEAINYCCEDRRSESNHSSLETRPEYIAWSLMKSKLDYYITQYSKTVTSNQKKKDLSASHGTIRNPNTSTTPSTSSNADTSIAPSTTSTQNTFSPSEKKRNTEVGGCGGRGKEIQYK